MVLSDGAPGPGWLEHQCYPFLSSLAKPTAMSLGISKPLLFPIMAFKLNAYRHDVLWKVQVEASGCANSAPLRVRGVMWRSSSFHVGLYTGDCKIGRAAGGSRVCQYV